MIRAAVERDAGELARIYNQALKPGVLAAAVLKPVSAENRIEWLRGLHAPNGAWIYESKKHGVTGWCALLPFAVRPGYPGIAEISMYVDEAHRAGVIGGRMLACLIDQGRKRGLRSLISIAYEKNVVSISGCLLAGFRIVAVMPQLATTAIGYENVAWVHRDLLEPDPPMLERLIASTPIEDRERGG